MKPSYLVHSRLRYMAACAVTCFITGCHFLHPAVKQDIQYIPLGDYKYTPAKVDSGTAMRVIAFSGGKDSDKDNIYYCQFITINMSNGDTVRVLSSLINYDMPRSETSNEYTMSAMYDGLKGITDATFMPPDSNQTIVLNLPVEVQSEKDGSAAPNTNDLSKITRPQLVAINKSLPMLQTPSYKTIIGVLHFKEMPW